MKGNLQLAILKGELELNKGQIILIKEMFKRKGSLQISAIINNKQISTGLKHENKTIEKLYSSMKNDLIKVSSVPDINRFVVIYLNKEFLF